MSRVDFRQVDVFTSVPFKGNPVAVIMDARSLTSRQMQEIARWTNLSETTFVLPPENPAADYRLRIFTPGSELPFAGHPTIGSAWALMEAGIVSATAGRLVQECAAGMVSLSVGEETNGKPSIAFELPSPHITPLSTQQIATLETLLGCALDRALTPALVDVGARWIVAQVADAATLLSVTPDYVGLREHDAALGITGVTLYGRYAARQPFSIEVRSFAPACGVNEDPVCGSGNGSVAAFMRYHAVRLPESGLVQASQGQVIGRDGKLRLRIANDSIQVGGYAVTCVQGTITC